MAHYLVTGATGYIGSMLVRYILADMPAARVTVLVRDVQKARAMLPEAVVVTGADITDAAAMACIDVDADYIVHCAAATQSAYMVSHPVETADSIVLGTRNVLELARRAAVRGMVYLSSMEVYGQIDCSEDQRVTENELGALDVLALRSCYPMGKRMAEQYCAAFSHAYGVPVCIARLAQTFGTGVSSRDQRIFMQFARAVRDQRDIVLHTAGDSMGNYCAIQDVLSAVLFLLEHGAAGEAYNVVNEQNTMRIRDMAALVADKIAGGRIGVVYDIPEGNVYGYAPTTGLRLSGQKLRSLGWQAETSLEEMYSGVLQTMTDEAW